MAVIKLLHVDNFRDALSGIGINGISFTEVKDFSRPNGHKELYRGVDSVIITLKHIPTLLLIEDQ